MMQKERVKAQPDNETRKPFTCMLDSVIMN